MIRYKDSSVWRGEPATLLSATQKAADPAPTEGAIPGLDAAATASNTETEEAKAEPSQPQEMAVLESHVPEVELADAPALVTETPQATPHRLFAEAPLTAVDFTIVLPPEPAAAINPVTSRLNTASVRAPTPKPPATPAPGGAAPLVSLDQEPPPPPPPPPITLEALLAAAGGEDAGASHTQAMAALPEGKVDLAAWQLIGPVHDIALLHLPPTAATYGKWTMRAIQEPHAIQLLSYPLPGAQRIVG
jgi:hypothetical protein